MTQRTSKFLSRAVFVATLVITVACGNSSSQTLPKADNPADGTGTDISTPRQTDGRIPSWVTGSVGISLPTTCSGTSTTCDRGTSLIGLSDITWDGSANQNIFAPLVDTFFRLELTGGRSSTVTGKVNLGFEDQYGFWGATLPTFDAASTLSNGQLDLIFSDSLLSVRFIATVANDQLQAANIYYRKRLSGETACQTVSYTCTKTEYYWDYTTQSWKSRQVTVDSSYCSIPQDTTGADCREYMKLSNSSVKNLGTITSTYSQWVK